QVKKRREAAPPPRRATRAWPGYRPPARRRVHPLRSRRRLPRADPADERRARGRAAHLRARGLPSRRKRAAPFVRKGSRRPELDAAALEPPPCTAADDADIGEEAKSHDDEPSPAQSAEVV